ncbi:MAG: response regulator [Bilophila wadsworthia]
MVAEDTAVTALFLSEALTQAGYAAHMASSGEDALYLIRKLQPDAVLLDMRLPDMTGLDIAGQIRSGELGVAPETPILVLTATLDPGDEQAFRRMGINRWLLKPVQAGKLASVVADLLPFTRKEQEETPMPASEPAEQPADVFDPPPRWMLWAVKPSQAAGGDLPRRGTTSGPICNASPCHRKRFRTLPRAAASGAQPQKRRGHVAP